GDPPFGASPDPRCLWSTATGWHCRRPVLRHRTDHGNPFLAVLVRRHAHSDVPIFESGDVRLHADRLGNCTGRVFLGLLHRRSFPFIGIWRDEWTDEQYQFRQCRHRLATHGDAALRDTYFELEPGKRRRWHPPHWDSSVARSERFECEWCEFLGGHS